MSEVRELAVDSTGTHFAAAAFERSVEVWSIESARRIAELDTCFEFGGSRLAIAGGDSPVIFAGAFNARGVEAYDLSGQQLWSRPDLKGTQWVSSCGPPTGCTFGVGIERRSFQLLDAESGGTLEQLRGVRAVYMDSDCSASVHVRKAAVDLIVGTARRRVRLESFAVLDVALSTEAVLFSEAAGPVRCIGHSGVERWRWDPGRGLHAVSATWCPARHQWLLVIWPFERGGELTSVALDTEGSAVGQHDLGSPAAHKFARRGELLVTSDAVLATTDGRALWRLE